MTVAEATPEIAAAAAPDRSDRAFLGHPKGLGYLAFAEGCERFSYYGMQALLVLYLVNYLLLPGNVENVAFFDSFRTLYGGLDGQPLASAIVGTYFAGVYLTPIFGGLLADRLLGKRRTVLMARSHGRGPFLMAFEASLLIALLCLVLGVGMFKGNIASQVGSLYKPEDLRRADAFQIFYLGINAGVIAAPLIVGTLGEKLGWHWGFGAAGVGMLVALGIYIAGQKYLPREHFDVPDPAARAAGPKLTRTDWLATLALVLLVPVMAVAIVPNNQIFNAYLVWGDQQFDLVFFGTRRRPLAGALGRMYLQLPASRGSLLRCYASSGESRRTPQITSARLLARRHAVPVRSRRTTPALRQNRPFLSGLFHVRIRSASRTSSREPRLFSKLAQAIRRHHPRPITRRLRAIDGRLGAAGSTMPTTNSALPPALAASWAGVILFKLFCIALCRRAGSPLA